jgi:hypothetical protein
MQKSGRKIQHQFAINDIEILFEQGQFFGIEYLCKGATGLKSLPGFFEYIIADLLGNNRYGD